MKRLFISLINHEKTILLLRTHYSHVFDPNFHECLREQAIFQRKQFHFYTLIGKAIKDALVTKTFIHMTYRSHEKYRGNKRSYTKNNAME